ncbi:hypothetical protein BA195_06780 [Tenacibaculum soleae]|uniref:Phage gp6-like head-tail connector protein n=1 Tax=Tenacibaculum soleae TaxID=447689 RepID=A0A1B9Y3N3_9FLAO|nr:head-tail connector protein [Tenacibaculum soleae]OCK44376.1 hypothetical protein BA195_06780 [Tenacibaculum soleae]
MARFTEIAHTPDPIITLAKAKKQCRIEADYTDEDDLLQDYIDASVAIAESKIYCAIQERKYAVTGKSFSDVLQFSKQKITAIDKIEYVDEAGNTQILSDDLYSLDEVDAYENKICFINESELPTVKKLTPNAVTLTVLVGYPAGKIPKDIKAALLMLVTDMYEKRMNFVQEKQTAVDNLLHKHRYYKVNEI